MLSFPFQLSRHTAKSWRDEMLPLPQLIQEGKGSASFESEECYGMTSLMPGGMGH